MKQLLVALLVILFIACNDRGAEEGSPINPPPPPPDTTLHLADTTGH